MTTTARPKLEGTAIAALVLSILSWSLGPFVVVPAIVCGHIAQARIRRDPALSGGGLALAGLIIGYTFAAYFLFMMIGLSYLWPVVQPPSF